MKFLSDIDVEQGSQVLLGSGEYLSWGTEGVTSIEGSTTSNRLRFYTSSTLSLTLDSSQNATFAGTATAPSFATSTDSGININGIALTRVAANSAIRVADGLETLGLLRSYAALNVGTTGTFGGNVTISGGGITLGGTGRIQGVDTVSASTDAANKAYVDAVNVGVTQITAGTNITISPVGGTGNVTINASGGGGGTIGGTIAITELAVGDATDSIDGSSKLTFTYVSGGAGYDKLRIGDGSTGSNQVLLDINTLGTGSSRGRLTLSDAGTLRGFLGITGGNEEVTLLSNDDLILSCGSGAADIIKLTTNSSERLRINYSGDVGIGNTDPASKLSVAGGIQMANDPETSTTNSDKAGTLRYREVNGSNPTPKANYSYIDMYMRTGSSSYEWVNIVTNNW